MIHSKNKSAARRGGCVKAKQALAIPKRLRVGVAAPAHNRPLAPVPAKHNEEVMNGYAAMARAQQAAESAMQRAAGIREQKKSKLTAEGVLRVWTDACREHMPDAVHLSVTKTDGAILLRYLKRTGRNAAASRAYVEWVCRLWSTVRAERFAWMQKDGGAPQVPSIRFLVRFCDKFEDAYSARQEVERLADASPREREVARLMRLKGMSRTAAEAEVSRREQGTQQAAEARKAKRDAIAAASIRSVRAEREAAAQQQREHWQQVAALKKSAPQTTLPDYDDLT